MSYNVVYYKMKIENKIIDPLHGNSNKVSVTKYLIDLLNASSYRHLNVVGHVYRMIAGLCFPMKWPD